MKKEKEVCHESKEVDYSDYSGYNSSADEPGLFSLEQVYPEIGCV